MKALSLLTRENVTNSTWKIIIDISGSTDGNQRYYETIHSMIHDWEESFQLIFFDHIAYCGQMEDWKWIRNQRKYKSGGTNPASFAPFLKEGMSILLFSDGQISQECLQQCDQILSCRYFKTVKVHFLSTIGSMNLSVSSPFTRNVGYYEIYKDQTRLSNGQTEHLFPLTYLENPELFFIDQNSFQQSILLRCMGNPQEKDRQSILKFKSQLLAKLRQRSVSTEEDSDRIRSELRSRGQPSLLRVNQWIQTYSGQEEKANQVEAFFSHLLNMCFQQNPNFQFDILSSFHSRLQRNGKSVDQPITITPVEHSIDSEWECPILLEKDSLCIPITKGKPCLEGLCKKELEELWINPLLFLDDKYKSRQDQWLSQLDVPIGFTCFASLNGKSAFTRRELHSLFSFESHDSHTASSLYSLKYCLMGTQKLFGNIHLWWIVFWSLLKKHQERWSSIFVPLESFIRRQCEQSKTLITLSGWVIPPYFSCPTDIALWYCMHSPFFLPTSSNRLQTFYPWASILMEVLETIFQFSTYQEDIFWIVSIYEAFEWMKQEKQRNPHWKFHIWGYHQGMILLGDQKTMYPVDGPCEFQNGQPCCIDTHRPLPLHDWKQIPLSILYELIKMVDHPNTCHIWKRSVSDWKSIASQPIPKVHYSYQYPLDLSMEDAMIPVPICQSTCRPRIDKDQSWKQWSSVLYGPLDGQLFLYRYFVLFVQSKNRYPTSNVEWLDWIYRRECSRFQRWTLPRRIRSFMKQLKEDYRQICLQMSIQEFKRCLNQSQSIGDRLQIQKTCPCCRVSR